MACLRSSPIYSLAAQVSTGNMAGAAAAIAPVVPGYLWMWLAAFWVWLIFVKLFSLKVQKTIDGQVTGGPAII